MITYNDYNKALIIKKSPIPKADFPSYAAEAERLILSTVTQPISNKYIKQVKATACRLCHQLFIDNSQTTATGQVLKSKSETSSDYSYSESYDTVTQSTGGAAAYQKIITDGLMYCNGEFTGLFYAGTRCVK